MSDGPHPPVESWANPLTDLINRWVQLHRTGLDAFLRALYDGAEELQCYRLMPWVRGHEPGLELTEEAETAVLKTIIRALDRVYDDTLDARELPAEHRRELVELRRRAAQAAQDRLDELVRSGKGPLKKPITIGVSR